jgi:SAM-dependent methyltransferase
VQSVRHPAPADRQWMRTVMNKDAADYLRALPPEQHEAVEVSGSDRAGLPWKSYVSLQYPEFDLCGDQLPDRAYDVVICEQVLEHVPDLTKAVANLRRLCRPGGRILVSTPFLVKIHGHPDDYWRLTSSGVRVLLEGAGLRIESIKTWGNRQCARRNLRKWAPYRPWHSLKNDPDVPMVVWAVARND